MNKKPYLPTGSEKSIESNGKTSLYTPQTNISSCFKHKLCSVSQKTTCNYFGLDICIGKQDKIFRKIFIRLQCMQYSILFKAFIWKN